MVVRLRGRRFDAVEPGNLDSFSRSRHLLSRDDNLALARLHAGRAHSHGLAIVQKNLAGLTRAHRLRIGFDFAVSEECAAWHECGSYRRAYGNHVIEVEYTDNGRAASGTRAATMGGVGRLCSATGCSAGRARRDPPTAPAEPHSAARLTSATPIVVSMLIAEDLLLLLTDDDTGKLQVDGTALDHGLAGAVLLELALARAVAVAEADDDVKRGRLVRGSGASGDAVLDEALTRLQRKVGKRPQDAVQSLTKGLRRTLYDRLAQRGIVRAEEDKVLGLFPRTRWPAVDSAQERHTQGQIYDALVHGVGADDRTSALIALLSAVDAVTKVVAPQDAAISKQELKSRAKTIASASWASQAVRKSIEAVHASVAAAVVAAGAASTVSSS